MNGNVFMLEVLKAGGRLNAKIGAQLGFTGFGGGRGGLKESGSYLPNTLLRDVIRDTAESSLGQIVGRT